MFLQQAARVPDGKWLHDMYSGQAGASGGLRRSSLGGPAKIVISNLDFGVSDKDIKVYTHENTCNYMKRKFFFYKDYSFLFIFIK